MKPVGIEVSSKRHLLVVMLLLPLFIAGSVWYVMGSTPSVGVTQRSFLTHPNLVNSSLPRTLEGLESFFYMAAKVQRETLTKGLRVFLLGTFVGISLLSSLILIRPLTDGMITFEIGLVRDKKRVLLYRIIPILLYSAYLSTVLTLFAGLIFPLTAGFSFSFEKALSLFAVLFLSSLWGITLTALSGFYTQEQSYPLIVSFLVSLASFTRLGDLIFPYYRLLNALWIDPKILNAWSVLGLTLMPAFALLAVHQFQRGEYY